MFISRIFMVLCVVAAPLYAGERQIIVTGEGQVQRVPDMAIITLGVSHQADNAADAVKDVAVSLGAILSALKEMGIDARDMQSSDLSLSPIRQHRSSGGDAPRVTGYTASSRVSVRVRDLEALSGILGRVTAEGANLFQGLQFALQDPAPAMNEARRLAVADGQAKAKLYAGAAGVILGPLISITEAGAGAPGPFDMARGMMAAEMAMPVAEGEINLSASVTMVFAIAD